MTSNEKDLQNSMVKFDIADDTMNLDIDSNNDGEKVVRLSLNISEAIKEAVSRGKAVEGVKLAAFEFQGSKLVILLDTDKDGTPLMALDIDLMEAFDEIKDLAIG